ncbi:hypothetical protein PPYR_01947, partial [Photinus pyralis]
MCILGHMAYIVMAKVLSQLNIPGGKVFPFEHEAVSTYFVGDEAFPLQTYLLRPYSKKSNVPMPEDEKIFNYR